MPTNYSKRIVLLGCGYTSVWAYKSLNQYAGRFIRKNKVEIVLLSDIDYHAFHGFTGEFLNGYLPMHHKDTSYQEIMKNVRYIKGKVSGICQKTQEVVYHTADSIEPQRLAYDELVVGVGSVDNEDTVKGIAQYGLSVKKVGGIKQCRERILNALQKAEKADSPEERKKYLTFAVAGGGFAAVEVSGNLYEYLETLKPYFPVLQTEGFEVILIHSGKEFLSEVQGRFKRMKRYSKKIIDQYGIKVLSDKRLVEISEEAVTLDDGAVIPTNVVICAIGQKLKPLDAEIPFELTPDGRIVADERLRAKGFDNIWVGGDVAYVKRPYLKSYCRHDALWAIKHGTRIGKNVARSIKGKKPGKFAYPGLGQTAGFGKNKAILELYGLQFTGMLAWISRIGFFLYFLPSRKSAWSAFKDLFKKRELFPKEYRIVETEIEEAAL